MNLSSDQFNQIRSDNMPRMDIANNALYKLADILGVDREFQTAAPDRAQFTSGGGGPNDPGWKQYGVSADPLANFAIGKLGKKKNKQQQNAVVFDETSYNNAVKKYQQDKAAFDSRARGMDAFTPDPGYQFRLDNTDKTIDRYQSSGRVTGGRAIKEAMRYGQDFASNEFGNATNRLFQLAGYGQAATNSTASAGMNSANQMGQYTMMGANAQANNYVNQANAVNNGLQNGAFWQSYNNWNKPSTRPTYGSQNQSMPSTDLTFNGPTYDWSR